jgi:Na+/H+ antiporter NhaD/arsenite permease-like protein
MFSLANYPQDHDLWLYLAYASGTGGSILIIGSAAGVAVMGMEDISFGWYAKKIGLPAFIGYTAGMALLAFI